MSQRIVIRKANKIIDVFHGEQGWEKHEHTRLMLTSNNFLKFVSGAKLSSQDFYEVKKQLGINFAGA